MNSDSELINEYLSGKRESFDILIQKYLPQVYGLALRLTRNPKEAEDIAQETFIKAWQKIESFDREKSFRPWLLTITRNTAFDFLKKRREFSFSDFENEEEESSYEESLKDESPSAEEMFEKAENAERLKKALDKLKANYRETLILHYKDELTFEEIGEIFKKSPNTVKSWHRRALIKLKEILSK